MSENTSDSNDHLSSRRGRQRAATPRRGCPTLELYFHPHLPLPLSVVRLSNVNMFPVVRLSNVNMFRIDTGAPPCWRHLFPKFHRSSFHRHGSAYDRKSPYWSTMHASARSSPRARRWRCHGRSLARWRGGQAAAPAASTSMSPVRGEQ
jgi:hypothetical protein